MSGTWKRRGGRGADSGGERNFALAGCRSLRRLVERHLSRGRKRFVGRADSKFAKRDPNVIFEVPIPENYDRYLGPALFEPFAKDMAARLKGEQTKNVLEIACGTGIL